MPRLKSSTSRAGAFVSACRVSCDQPNGSKAEAIGRHRLPRVGLERLQPVMVGRELEWRDAGTLMVSVACQCARADLAWTEAEGVAERAREMTLVGKAPAVGDLGDRAMDRQWTTQLAEAADKTALAAIGGNAAIGFEQPVEGAARIAEALAQLFDLKRCLQMTVEVVKER